MNPPSDRPVGASPIERRHYKRRWAVDFVWYKVLPKHGEDTSASAEGLSNMCDISKTGIGLYVTQNLPIGTMVFLEIGANRLNLSAVGEVVSEIRIREHYYRTGIRFKVIPPNDRMALYKFVGKK